MTEIEVVVEVEMTWVVDLDWTCALLSTRV